MRSWTCRVVDQTGHISELVRDSVTEDSLAHELSVEGFFPLSIEPRVERSGGRERFSRQTIIEFTDTLAIMIDSGLSVRDALEVSRAVFSQGPAKRLVDSIAERVKRGNSFHSVIQSMHRSFPPVYRGLVRIGERVGSLETILKQLARYLNDDKKLRDKLTGSLMYPILVLCVAFVGVIGIVVIVFPKIRAMLQDLSQSSPGAINHILGSITGTFAGGIVAFAVAATVVLSIILLRRTDGPAAERLDTFLLRLPIAGTGILRMQLFLFCFAMEILTSSGVTVEEALSESAEVISNRGLRSAIIRVKGSIETGAHMSEAFLRQRVFPERIGRWIGIGERIGSVDTVFAQLRGYYQSEVDKWTTRFMNLLEPALIVMVGGLIMYLVFTFIIPIFSIFNSIP